MSKLDAAGLINLSNQVAEELHEREISFLVRDEEDTATVFVKRLSSDENHEIAKIIYDDSKKVLVHDMTKIQVQATIFDHTTKQPLFASVEEVGKLVDPILNALHKASDEVNDFSGKKQIEYLTKKNSGANSSAAESAEEPSQKPSET
jgi:hypothetical protein